MNKVAAIVLNYRTPEMTIECLRSLAVEIAGDPSRCAVCVDNASGDDSIPLIRAAIEEHGWDHWLTLIESQTNLGFAGGNNLGIESVEAEHYLLLNSDGRLRPGALSQMLATLEANPRVGAVGPRLEWPDGDAQTSCFRYRTPLTEFLEAAGTGVLDRLLRKRLVPIGVPEQVTDSPWLSFACILVRGEVIDQIGLLDDGYFMYFEDIDYARRMRRAGWRLMHDPAARVVHLRGGSSAVKAAIKNRARVPRYYYESRSRYFAKFYGGRIGLAFTNACWLAGRTIALAREVVERRQRGACELEAFDNWTNFLSPLRASASARGGGER